MTPAPSSPAPADAVTPPAPPAPARSIKPYIAAARVAWRCWSAERRAGRASPADESPADPPPAFVLACGRSGAASLCQILSTHPQVRCLAEMDHYWAAIDRRTDAANLYYDAEPMFFMDARHASARAKARFNRLFNAPPASTLIEKSSRNVCRIGFLDALAPAARYLHLVRDGADVARSIEKIASGPDCPIAGKTDFNPWWGASGSAWAALARDGATAGYFAEEVGPLQTHAQRGAYQWLVSLAEADRWRHRLGPRFAEITFTAMTTRPRDTVAAVCAHLGITADPAWIVTAAAGFVPDRPRAAEPLSLPPRMAAAFNAQQERYGFRGRAAAL